MNAKMVSGKLKVFKNIFKIILSFSMICSCLTYEIKYSDSQDYYSKNFYINTFASGFMNNNLTSKKHCEKGKIIGISITEHHPIEFVCFLTLGIYCPLTGYLKCSKE